MDFITAINTCRVVGSAEGSAWPGVQVGYRQLCSASGAWAGRGCGRARTPQPWEGWRCDLSTHNAIRRRVWVPVLFLLLPCFLRCLIPGGNASVSCVLAVSEIQTRMPLAARGLESWGLPSTFCMG